MEEFNAAIFDIVAEHRPCSVRHVYYQAVSIGLVPKDVGRTRASEKKVGRALNEMREASLYYPFADARDGAEQAGLADEDLDEFLARMYRGVGIMPFRWITDNTRTRFQADQYASKDAALNDMARMYRRDLWRAQRHYVEVWCESDSIAGVLNEVTWDYGLGLLPCRGQAPKRFVWDSAQTYAEIGKPVACLYVGDFDPNGIDIGNSVKERLWRYSPDPDIDVEFHRLAIEPEQIRDLGLTGHGLNPNIADRQRDRFFELCDVYRIPREAVEAEALDPTTLRQVVRGAIESYIDPRQWQLELAVEEQERRSLWDLARGNGAGS